MAHDGKSYFYADDSVALRRFVLPSYGRKDVLKNTRKEFLWKGSFLQPMVNGSVFGFTAMELFCVKSTKERKNERRMGDAKFLWLCRRDDIEKGAQTRTRVYSTDETFQRVSQH